MQNDSFILPLFNHKKNTGVGFRLIPLRFMMILIFKCDKLPAMSNYRYVVKHIFDLCFTVFSLGKSIFPKVMKHRSFLDRHLVDTGCNHTRCIHRRHLLNEAGSLRISLYRSPIGGCEPFVAGEFIDEGHVVGA